MYSWDSLRCCFSQHNVLVRGLNQVTHTSKESMDARCYVYKLVWKWCTFKHTYMHTVHRKTCSFTSSCFIYLGYSLPVYALIYLVVIDCKEDLTLAICTAMYLYVYGESIFSGNLYKNKKSSPQACETVTPLLLFSKPPFLCLLNHSNCSRNLEGQFVWVPYFVQFCPCQSSWQSISGLSVFSWNSFVRWNCVVCCCFGHILYFCMYFTIIKNRSVFFLRKTSCVLFSLVCSSTTSGNLLALRGSFLIVKDTRVINVI